MDFQTVDFEDDAPIRHEAFVFEKQKKFFKDMRAGNDSFLKDQFYESPWYRFWKQREQT